MIADRDGTPLAVGDTVEWRFVNRDDTPKRPRNRVVELGERIEVEGRPPTSSVKLDDGGWATTEALVKVE